MSFFNVIDTFFLWIFAIITVTLCVTINHFEEQQLLAYDKEPNKYHIQVMGETTDKELENDVNFKLYAKYALLMDATNRRILYEKAGFEKVPMASTTKIMTLIIALENGNLDDMVEVSSYAASMPDVQLGIRKGEQYRLGDLVYSLMLESHNDTAVAIAEHVGGSVEQFASMMNEKAKELGCQDTNFVTPNGLDAENHYTTAADLACIASYAIENEDFLKIIATPTYSFHEQTAGRNFTVNNKDRFLTSYEGAIGIKTGFTGNAGYCFVGAVRRDNRRFISVVLACGWPPNKSYKWKDTTALMNYGVENYNEKQILEADTAFSQIEVLNSIEGTPLIPYSTTDVSLLLKEGEKVDFNVELPSQLEAPVKRGQSVGKITICINDETYQVVPLVVKESRKKITFSYIFKSVALRYFMVR